MTSFWKLLGATIRGAMCQLIVKGADTPNAICHHLRGLESRGKWGDLQ